MRTSCISPPTRLAVAQKYCAHPTRVLHQQPAKLLDPDTNRRDSNAENTRVKMGNNMGRSANRMAIAAMANATHFGKDELLRMQVRFVAIEPFRFPCLKLQTFGVESRSSEA